MWSFVYMIHIGKIIRKKQKESGFSVVEFARRINTSRENAYTIFNRSSPDVLLLARICDVLDFNFFTLVLPEKFKQYSTESKEETMMFYEKEVHYLKEIKKLKEELNKLK